VRASPINPPSLPLLLPSPLSPPPPSYTHDAQAIAEHERACNELIAAEEVVQSEAAHEERRQVAEAAAAAARAKRLVAAAAMAKAQEEANITAA
jgi:hypothetical protein